MVAMKCEVADTPTGVVMKCKRGIRTEPSLMPVDRRRIIIHGRKKQNSGSTPKLRSHAT